MEISFQWENLVNKNSVNKNNKNSAKWKFYLVKISLNTKFIKIKIWLNGNFLSLGNSAK